MTSHVNNYNRVTDINKDFQGNTTGMINNRVVIYNEFSGLWFDAITGQFIYNAVA